MPHSFAFLKDCSPLDLVRVKLNDTSEMGIVGKQESRQFQALVVLPEKMPPFIVNLLQNGHIDGDFDTYKVLNYGGEYHVRPVHEEACQVAEGPLFKKAGSLVLSEDGMFVLALESPTSVRYFDVKTGTVHGERGGGRAAFKFWGIWLKDASYGNSSIVNYYGERE
jgi:hypothetical protein